MWGATVLVSLSNTFRGVSIHTPTRGATSQTDFTPISSKFQSTLPRRERRHAEKLMILHACFNPRSHAGSDCGVGVGEWFCRVSIHAPMQGATLQRAGVTDHPEFQSTLPCRERRQRFRDKPNNPMFQSTLPCRERLLREVMRDARHQFQSTLPCRERPLRRRCLYRCASFQSTLPCRERHCSGEGCARQTSFNPRSHAGSDTACVP